MFHYNTEHGASAPDQSKLLFKLDDQVANEAFIMPFANPDWVNKHTMLIPAGQSAVKHAYSASFTDYIAKITGGETTLTTPLQIHASGLHMHLLGQATRLHIERLDGSQTCLLDIPRWDFHWQSGYVLKNPVTVAPGDRLHLECLFDNPGPKDVNWGEGTEDEMCLGFVYVAP